MSKNLQKYHPKPCANCGHREMHGEVAGCIASTGNNSWCDCDTYVSPRERAKDAREGARLAQEGAEAAGASYAMTVNPDGPAWRTAAEARMETLIATGQEFTAEDVTDVVGSAPSPNAIGSLFKAKEFRDRMAFVTYRKATRPQAHSRALAVWKGVPEVTA